MINNLNDYLSGIAIGIRYRPNFTIEDKLGEIVDSILYAEDSIFNPKIFPEVDSSFGNKTLINQKTEDKMQIDKANFILDLNFEEDSILTKNDKKTIVEKYELQILRGALQKYKIEDIIRVGFLQKFHIKDEELIKRFLEKASGASSEGIKEAMIRFSKSIALGKSLVKKNVDDYDTVIYTASKKADESELLLLLDYQSFFSPFLPSVSLIEYKNFIEKANNYCFGKFLNWVNNGFLER